MSPGEMRKHLTTFRRLFNRALEDPRKGVTSRFPSNISSAGSRARAHTLSIDYSSTIADISAERCRSCRSKIFDSQMAVVPSSPFRFLVPLFSSRSSCVRTHSFLLSLSPRWIESRSYSSKHCERRQSIRVWWNDCREISGLLSPNKCESVCRRAMISLMMMMTLLSVTIPSNLRSSVRRNKCETTRTSFVSIFY